MLLIVFVATFAVATSASFDKDSDPLQVIQERLRPLQKQLKAHPIYDELNSTADLEIFMQHHVFAVLDFMSLLKYLQNTFAPSSFPWKPHGNPSIRRFINEIVTEEESDYANAAHEGYSSHFELYCSAMNELDISSEAAQLFASQLTDLSSTIDLLSASNIPPAAKHFLSSTFSTLKENKPHVVAASFTFGRETIIPLMFKEFLKRMHIKRNDAPTFFYYLDRHIEVDGDNHGPMSMLMLKEICGDDVTKWAEVESGAVNAIKNRISLWDDVLQVIQASKLDHSCPRCSKCAPCNCDPCDLYMSNDGKDRFSLIRSAVFVVMGSAVGSMALFFCFSIKVRLERRW